LVVGRQCGAFPRLKLPPGRPQRIDREHRNHGKREDMLPPARELIELASSRMLGRE